MHSTANPIYNRLTRSRRMLSERAVRWIGAVSGVIGFAAGAVAALMGGVLGEVTIGVLLCVGMALGALFLLIGCALTAMITASFASDHDLVLLRLSRVTPVDIVDGYTGSAGHRLRLLRAVGLRLPAGLVGAAILVGIPAAAIGASHRPSMLFIVLDLIFGVLAAAPTVAYEILNFTALWRGGIDVGVWIGLRWAHEGQIASGVVILTGVAASIPLAAGLILYPGTTLSAAICASALTALWLHSAAARISQIAHERAVQILNNRDTLWGDYAARDR